MVAGLAIDWLMQLWQRNRTWLLVGARLAFGLLLLVWWGVHGAH